MKTTLTQPLKAEFVADTKLLTLTGANGEIAEIDVHNEGNFIGWIMAVLQGPFIKDGISTQGIISQGVQISIHGEPSDGSGIIVFTFAIMGGGIFSIGIPMPALPEEHLPGLKLALNAVNAVSHRAARGTPQ